MLNGHEAMSPIPAAQQALADACIKVPKSHQAISISAYVNTVVNGATLSALVEYCTTRCTEEAQMDFDTIWLKHLTAQIARFTELAEEQPKILTIPGLPAGHG